MPIGAPELLILLVILLVLFGAGKLSGVGAALGRSVRDFRTTALDDSPPANSTSSATPTEAPSSDATRTTPADATRTR